MNRYPDFDLSDELLYTVWTLTWTARSVYPPPFDGVELEPGAGGGYPGN
jgi:hypothetical protein